MTTRSFLIIFCGLLHIGCANAQDDAGPMRYRGDYTRGHEVNSFCPAINSQCYWVGSKTDINILEALKELAKNRSALAYESICIVIDATIDRETPREGFAADYDGLVTVTRVFGTCEETTVLTQGDLQHHRWVLESVNGLPVSPEELEYLVPELDFGERMHVAGNTGCNRFTGTGVLREAYFSVASMAMTARACGAAQSEIEQKVQPVLSGESTISMDDDNALTLSSGDSRLRFVLLDWRH